MTSTKISLITNWMDSLQEETTESMERSFSSPRKK